jgi:[protein-PII] uridylyltransferase
MTAVKQPFEEFGEVSQAEFLSTGNAEQALSRRTVSVDDLVLETARKWLLPVATEGLSVLAVGGYGRQQLFPYSDIDLLLLFSSERQAQNVKDSIASFLQELWDRGLRVSHSVRTPAECLELHDSNIELNISLLDQRFLAGDQALYAGLASRLPRFVHSQRLTLARNLSRLTRERHAKYQHTFYHLEPNIKEAPGNLRDFHVLCWLEKLHDSGTAAADLKASFRFLAKLRCYLHFRAQRDQNVLTFEVQENIPETWGPSAPEEWMRSYFRHARAIYQLAIRELEASEAQSSRLFAQFRELRSNLSNADFTVTRGRVHLRMPHRLEAEPELLIRLFQFVARHGIRPSLEVEHRIQSMLPQLSEYFRQPRALWPAIKELLHLPHTPLALRAMHETGALWVLFTELEAIECLVIRDFYHRYTVDEHTLVAIQILWELGRDKDPRDKRFADLLSELEAPAVAVFALLFHDAGKGTTNNGHVKASVGLAETAMERIGMPPAEQDMVRFLIARHLELSSAMHSRDIYDPASRQYLAHQMGTVERLKALTLLTYADISAVNPQAMTPWRAEQLWQIYLATYNELTRELGDERIHTSGTPEKIAFVEGFPTRYLRTHSEAEIHSHLDLEARSRSRGVAADLTKLNAAYRLTLVAADRPFLFASIAGTLAAFGMNILKAEAFANQRGVVLDTFTFSDPLRNLELNPPEIDRLRTTVERVILGRQEVKHLLQNRPKAEAPTRDSRVRTAVAFDSESSAGATLIQIVAQDRPGLLYDLAWAISSLGCNIDVVLIDTEGHKAIDVFYVTAGGEKLSPELRETLAVHLKLACEGEQRPV